MSVVSGAPSNPDPLGVLTARARRITAWYRARLHTHCQAGPRRFASRGKWALTAAGVPSIRLRTKVAFRLVLVTLALHRLDAKAQGAEHAAGDALAGAAAPAVVLMLLPSSAGPEIVFRRDGTTDTRFILAWPFQIPLDHDFRTRLVLAPEVAIGAANDAVVRGRAGLRLGDSFWIAGLGLAFDKESAYLSPELGIRLPRRHDHDDFQLGATLVLRTDVPLRENPEPRVSALVGWTLM